MDRQSPREKQPETNRTVAGVTPTAAPAVAMATASSGSTTCTPTSSASLSLLPPDRQAVQVIQHAVHRPQSMTAQYLHQMYAAQQHHIMLQTAALQQHQHQPHLQSLASLQQASVCQRQSPSSSSSSSSTGGSQNSITLPASPVTAQLISRTQASSTSAAAASISQQAMLLGNRPANCNQAQMYLRTQMLILTPAATVAAVPSDLPAVTSSSSSTSSSQVQNLALRAHLPGVLLKPPTQTTASLTKTSASAPKANPPAEASDKGQDVSRSSGSQIATPAFSPVQTHAMVKQQLSGPLAQRVAHHQLILQQGAASQHRGLHPIALRVAPQDTQALPLSLKRLADTKPPSSTSADSAHPQPPPLVAAPQRRTSFSQVQNHPPPPPPPLVQPKMPSNPPSSLHRPFLQTGQLLLTEQELPVAEALIQMPYQNLPPPQTVAVDLKVVRKSKTSSPEQTVNGTTDKKEEVSSHKRRTPPPSEAAPKQNGAVRDAASSPPVSRSSPAEAPAPPTPSGNSSSNPPPPPLPPAILPAPARGPSQPASAPTSLPGSPDRMQGAQILTHLIEGFVIREGLEPFPVVQTSVLADQQASLPESQENHTNGDATAEDSPADADPSDSSDSEMEDDAPAPDAAAESPSELLQCEFCGGKGYADTFLKSKRFCSVSCGKRYSVSYTKRFSLIRAGRWGHRPVGRRGRPPSRVNGASREQFLKQLKDHRQVRTSKPEEIQKESTAEDEEAETPAPMATRLRTQAERAKRREEEQEQRTTETITLSDGEEEEEEEEEGEEEGVEVEEEDTGSPSQWNVEQVFSYINSLPGGQEVAQEFRSQEIDGQALLLLTEDHLVSSMNLKLGPALKLCAHINSLKDKN
ncbi:polyhomeotic-like protein 3 [Synchiropus splendidus]|uniref:polyhomeotic-like protein 3 n=1 Tax=Synchiropus splendidus TaxID=270530 RepID=UPI00237E564D|nr:polyhomeotic-like protein 3 [Synchiropus splendidus]